MHPLDCRFAMRLGSNYFTLYIASLPLAAAAIHFKDTALQTKAQIVLGAGPTLRARGARRLPCHVPEGGATR